MAEGAGQLPFAGAGGAASGNGTGQTVERERRMQNAARILKPLIEFKLRRSRQEVAEKQVRIGRSVVTRSGMQFIETWQDGLDTRQVESDLAEVRQLKDLLEKERRRLSRSNQAKKKAAAAAAAVAGASQDPDGDDAMSAGGGASSQHVPANTLEKLAVVSRDESLRVRWNAVKRQEASLVERKKQLGHERQLLRREIKRIQDEEDSRFRHRPILHRRYQLMSLLGRGGFSEVWRAVDLDTMAEVAVKVHQLNSHWSHIKKQSYITHATREYRIHSDLVHDNVVRLFDVFEIDSDSFATVQQFCRGTDLDALLKQSGTLSEREARSIVMQVMAALRYLNKVGDPEAQRPRVIHYDLKPANILFDELRTAKVTDFGLSKQVDDQLLDTQGGMELTSQGAGTYWYLPPECFKPSPRISDKVDVWSVGVIFYQMLYGKKPFGEGMSQDDIYRHGTIRNAGAVEFPDKPTVSKDAKDFIRFCLQPEQADRPSVAGLSQHKYLLTKIQAKRGE